tara:strand:+ start:10870 stop:11325 length:456 start_codon:yes stop_codon:yes gene_type:complete
MSNKTKFVEDKSSATFLEALGSIFDGCQDQHVSYWGVFKKTTHWQGVDSRCGEVTHPELGVVATLTQIRRPNGVTGLAWRSTHAISQGWDICEDYARNEQELARQAQEEYEASRSLQKDREDFVNLKRGYKGTHLSAHLKRIGREDLLYLV